MLIKLNSEIIEEARLFILGESYGPLTINIQSLVDLIKFTSGEIIEKKDKKLKKRIKLIEKIKQEKLLLGRKNQKLESRMFLDSLTRITNRGKFDLLLKQLFKKGNDFSLLFFDIDYFKKVNDNYGHLSGDLVLKELARIIKDKIKSKDVFARYGGEEFIIILPGTDISGGKKFSERIRKLVEGISIINDESEEINVTISIGVVEKKEGDNQNSLLKRADKALYEAKDLGRNRVVSK